MIRIVDNKKVEMTDDEWRMYEKICQFYTKAHFNGADLFQGLFETDGQGYIVFINPPQKQSSFEVLFFLFSLMVQQQTRLNNKRYDDKIAEIDAWFAEAKAKYNAKET